MAELLHTGVSIGVCHLEDIFCEDDFGTHKWTTLAVFIQLAYPGIEAEGGAQGGVLATPAGPGAA